MIESVRGAAWLDLQGNANDWAMALISGRQNFTPRRLADPGPSEQQLRDLLDAAATAPDHGELTPWHFVLIPATARARLGCVFSDALLERDASATAQQQADARDKALRAPCLLMAIVDLRERSPSIPAFERLVSLGAAIQNMLLLSRAMGFGSGLSSGHALRSAALRKAFGLATDEHGVCFVSFGTVAKARTLRARPGASDICSTFADEA